MRLGDIATLVRGNGLPKSDFAESGVGCIHYGQIYTYYRNAADKTISFVSEETAQKLKQVEMNDIIITNTSENVDDVCKAVVWEGDENIVTGGHATIIKGLPVPRFFAYYTQTNAFRRVKMKLATGTKVIDISAANLANVIIPLPPLEEQQRIVDILDRFDTLCNDISSGLPAEIKMRQQQYEHYRDKLLSFKKLEA